MTDRPDPSCVVDTPKLAELLGVEVSKLRTWRARGSAPVAGLPEPWVEVSGSPAWWRADIDAWLAERGTLNAHMRRRMAEIDERREVTTSERG